jgi:riboflavin synthase
VFTGIVRERGRVVAADRNGDDGGLRLRIAAPQTAAQTTAGDSVSVAGCCLTAVSAKGSELAFEAVLESLARTTLGTLMPGYVQGHVDGVGRVRSIEHEGDGVRLWLDVPPELLRYCVEKGSLAVDGVSLTIAALDEGGVGVALVPHTLQETTLSALVPGDPVNLETDVLAKYVERLVHP